jgi:heat shock protein HslJ
MHHSTRHPRIIAPVLAVLVVLTVPACGGTGDTAGDRLEGSRWEMTSVSSGATLMAAHPTTIATAVFSDGIISGSTGCNRYQASYAFEGNSISLGDIALTGVACDPEHVEQGEAFSRALGSISGFSVSDAELEFIDETGAVQLRFRPASELPHTGITWQLVWYDDGISALDGSTISLSFGSDGTLRGLAGCNSYGADYLVEGGMVTIGMIARTVLACQEPPGVMEQENDYLAALESVTAFSTTLTGLELRDDRHVPVAEFRFGGRIRRPG